MLKVHRYSSILKPSVSAGTRKQVMPLASPSLPEVRANIMSWVATCTPVFHIFAPLMSQPFAVALTARAGLHPGGVRAVLRLGQAERDAILPVEHASIIRPSAPRCRSREHQYDREIADDRSFVLQVVVQAQALCRANARG